jgi:hypothetical protein
MGSENGREPRINRDQRSVEASMRPARPPAKPVLAARWRDEYRGPEPVKPRFPRP